MNWITVSWPMVAGACLTLGLIELRIGISQPPRAARLLFSLSAFAMAASSGVELALMRTETLADARVVLCAMDVVVGAVVASLTAFIWVYFGTGNKWLALAGPSVYAVGAAFDLVPGSTVVYQAVTGLRAVKTFGGATFNVVEGELNPWDVFPYLGALLMTVFVVDASARLWRRGGRRRALVIGGSVSLFILIAGVHSALVDAGIVKAPYMFSWAFIAILGAMASELNVDVRAAAQLALRLRDSERRVDLASAAADLGMWSWDIVEDTIWATSQARALFGFSESERISFAHLQAALHPEDRDAVERAIESTLATDGAYEVEYRVRLPDGPTRWIASRGQVDRDARGTPTLMRGVVLDVSARRSTEVELQQLRTQLAHASRVSMMGQLASALAHELSQPLGAILRNTEAAELFLQHDPPDLDELRSILVDIRKDDQRAGGVIERLRALLKRRSFAPRALLVSDLLESVAALARFDSSTRKAQLEIDAAPQLPAIVGDPVHLQQVLLNLVLNAMDAVEEMPAERRKVTVRAERLGDVEVAVAVSDTGPGIAPDKRERLFEPFFTTKANGLGVGLSISRSIIEAHGGRIWVEEKAREGATFRFTLPVAGQPAAS